MFVELQSLQNQTNYWWLFYCEAIIYKKLYN
jgi:hypothetical protein